MQLFRFFLYCLIGLILFSCSLTENESSQPGSYTFSGTIKYHDKAYDRFGFIQGEGEEQNPLRYTKIVVFDDKGAGYTTYSDSNGAFQVSIPETSSQLNNVLVLAESKQGSGAQTAVLDSGGRPYEYTHLLQRDNNSIPLTNVDISIPLSQSGAFNLIDVANISFEFISHYQSLEDQFLLFVWDKTSSFGTRYCPEESSFSCEWGSAIYVSGDDLAASDVFDDDRLWHEIGHYYLDMYSVDNSPGGCHKIDDKGQDIRLSWSEGWSNFFSMALKDWLLMGKSIEKQYISTNDEVAHYILDLGSEGSLVSIDVSNLSPTDYVYSTNEVAVSKILWEIYLNYGFELVSNGVSSFTQGEISSLETFWQHIRESVDEDIAVQVFGERSVSYLEDEYEPDNLSERLFPIGSIEKHNFYSTDSADVDQVVFSPSIGTSYIIETKELTNGADTIIRLLNLDGSPLIVNGEEVINDDWDSSNYRYFDIKCNEQLIDNNSDALASKIIFQPVEEGNIIVEITTPSIGYKTAGSYGSYTLSISEINE